MRCHRVAYATHVLGDEDVSLEILENVVRGRGINVVDPVRRLCRELSIGLTGRDVREDERAGRLAVVAVLAEASLVSLAARHRG